VRPRTLTLFHLVWSTHDMRPAQDDVLGDHDTPPLPPSLRELRLLEAFSRGERGIGLRSLGTEVRLVAATDPGPLLQVCADHVRHGLSWRCQVGSGDSDDYKVRRAEATAFAAPKTHQRCPASCLSSAALQRSCKDAP